MQVKNHRQFNSLFPANVLFAGKNIFLLFRTQLYLHNFPNNPDLWKKDHILKDLFYIML